MRVVEIGGVGGEEGGGGGEREEAEERWPGEWNELEEMREVLDEAWNLAPDLTTCPESGLIRDTCPHCTSERPPSPPSPTQPGPRESQAQPFLGLVEAAAAWSREEVEERLAELLEAAGLVLADARTAGDCTESRLAAIQLVVTRLAPLVPVTELEDSVMCPALTAIQLFMEQATDHLGDCGEEGVGALLDLQRQLLVLTLALVTLAREQQGLGVGEVPSLPRRLDPILTTAFACVRQVPAEVAAQAKQAAENLLASFLEMVKGTELESQVCSSRRAWAAGLNT